MKKPIITSIFVIVIVLGFIFGSNLEIPYKYTAYIAVAILAFLDSLFGGIVSNMKNEFNMTVFVSGFFVNAVIAIFLVYLGQKLNVDIYLAAIVVFVGRMFTNLTIIRRYYVDKWSNKLQDKNTKNAK